MLTVSFFNNRSKHDTYRNIMVPKTTKKRHNLDVEKVDIVYCSLLTISFWSLDNTNVAACFYHFT